MKWNDIGVGRRLWLVVLGLLVAMLAIAAWAQVNSANVMDNALRSVLAYEGRISDAIRWRGMTETATTMVEGNALTADPAIAKLYDGRVKGLIAQISAVQERITKASTTDESKAALQAIADQRTRVLALTARVAEVRNSGADVQAFVERDFRPAIDLYLKALDNFVTVQEGLRDQARAAAEDARRTGSFTGLAAIVLVFLIGIGLTVALVRSIVRPLERALKAADAIASGDLTQRLDDPRRDEFGQLLRALSAMTERLRGLVSEVRNGVESVSTASTEIASGNHDLSARTEQTASNLQQTAASMEELTSTVTQSADTARQANQLASTAAQAATQGGEVVGQVVRSMQDISEASRKIADIIGTIDAIAFQTNILALNAAVEAARAGEQGRGFAVVASEVRALAGRSAEAAKEIKALINASVQTVETGSAQVEHAGASMQEIVASVRRVSDLIGEISASSTEQRDGIAQVNQAVTQLDQMTQQNAALVEESAAAASGLKDQAQRLSEVVAVFNVGSGAVQTLAPRSAVVAAPAPAPAPAKRPAPAVAAPAAKRLAPAPAAVRAPAAAAPKAAPKPAARPAAPKTLAAPARTPAPARPKAASAEEGEWESF
ncbi:methyl-accepting chemotaxis protein I [Pseudorhodoferax aquiterrae]|uniref:Methyl-accepting chemotaxis protein I n=1 Tax=Pseudorhodoferax aquiterrae TaxID=747304 RepID=A0ABQ3FXE2_9BURK|nr:methyl-accepting chemotaxis protein [Pseudorhodoferax aquiterrae]GHC73242.1 methyl-accepting chemotaxis protein I [Pseudorhodoferax aquiterrae]